MLIDSHPKLFISVYASFAENFNYCSLDELESLADGKFALERI